MDRDETGKQIREDGRRILAEADAWFEKNPIAEEQTKEGVTEALTVLVDAAIKNNPELAQNWKDLGRLGIQIVKLGYYKGRTFVPLPDFLKEIDDDR